MMARIARRSLRVLALVAGTALAAACGQGSQPTQPASASHLPSSVPLYVTIKTDPDDPQWRNAELLLRRIPGGADLLDKEPDGSGLDVQELREALGPEIGVAVLELGSRDETPVVVAAQPADPERLVTLLEEGDTRPAYTEVDGWFLIAQDQATLDRAVELSRAGGLAGNESFRETFSELDPAALVRLYVDLEVVADELRTSLAEAPGLGGIDLGELARLGGAGLALEAAEAGIGVTGVLVADDRPGVPEYDTELASVPLTEIAPASVLLYASSSSPRSSIEEYLDTASGRIPGLEAQLRQLELGLGITLDEDILPLLDGESALYLRDGPVPELTLLLSPQDPDQALATIERLAGSVASLGAPGRGQAPPSVLHEEVAGIPALRLDVPGGQTSLWIAKVGQQVVATTARSGISGLLEGPRLADDPEFAETASAAGLPVEYDALVYLDIPRLVETAASADTGFGEQLPTPPPGANAFGKALLYVTSGPGTTLLEGFVSIPGASS